MIFAFVIKLNTVDIFENNESIRFFLSLSCDSSFGL